MELQLDGADLWRRYGNRYGHGVSPQKMSAGSREMKVGALKTEAGLAQVRSMDEAHAAKSFTLEKYHKHE